MKFTTKARKETFKRFMKNNFYNVKKEEQTFSLMRKCWNFFYKTLDTDTLRLLHSFKKTDSGRYGKAFEIAVKQVLNGLRGNACKVSAKGKNDCQSKGIIYEIKSNCGELNDIEKNDYIIYSMNNQKDCETPEKAKVIPSKDFMTIIEKCGLLRTKKTTAGYKVLAIQSYKNSKKKTSMLCAELKKYPTLKEWVKQFQK